MMRWLVPLVMMLPAYAQAEDRLGRLFMTPVERSNLDYLRKSSKPPEKILPAGEEGQAAEVTEDAAAALPPPVVTVQGFVKRSDGRGTVWVNHQPVQEKTTTGDFAVGKLAPRDNRVEVKVKGSNKPVSLKAGQSYDPASGMVVDNPRQLPAAEPPPQGLQSTESAAPSTVDSTKKP